MTADITTPWGDALPPFPAHSITVHLPKWVTMLQFVDNAQEVISKVKSMYPRFGPFGEVRTFVGRLSSECLEEGQACLPFASRDSAEACRDFMLAENRKENKCEPQEVHVKAYDFRVRIWVTFFPAARMPAAIPFWQDQGTGVSSRIARECLDHYDLLKQVGHISSSDEGLDMANSAFGEIKDRISALLNRAPRVQHRANVSAHNVFLYPTGMAAIYQFHRYLQRSSTQPGTTVLFGFAFHSTPHVYKEYSSKFEWFGRGDDEELDQLETFCATETDAGRKIQAVWLEFPTNPNLRTVDIRRLRALADKFGFYLVVDETISSFCNVDLLDMADVLVTSLTKSFSGYADVMGGSVVVNPNSQHYDQLIELCNANFVNEFYSGDAEALARNSRDYLKRAKRLNDNAQAVVEYLHGLIKDPSSSVSGVAYPSVGPGAEFYKPFMRPETPDSKPGFGCLFSVELDSIESTVAFYDNLHVHNGPHLGANLTLVLPYVKAIHAKEVQWTIECGMNERMIRVSVGLEKTEDLLQTFRTAVEAADAVKAKEPIDKLVNPLN